MNEIEKGLEQLLDEKRILRCSLCHGKLIYDGAGMYHCVVCGHQELDDFGKVKKFLEENGASSAIKIQEATGVTKKNIERMLKEGRLGVVKESKIK